jgi:hypothetical protein
MEIPTLVHHPIIETAETNTLLQLHPRMKRPHRDEAQEWCNGASVALGALDGPSILRHGEADKYLRTSHSG